MKTKFELWYENISSDDIDLINKLVDNICDSEISAELVGLIKNNKDKYFPRIEKYIKEHIIDYVWFIKSEVCNLWKEGLVSDICDYSSGLYNCDEIYVRAIADALGFLWLVN